jgi:urocanate hydratase
MSLPLATIGTDVLSYGSTGATIGSIIPGVGTAIGGAIGAGVGFVMGLFDSNADSEAEKAARKQAEFNKFLADQAAADALTRAESEVGRRQLETGQAIGEVRADLGASGVVGSQGSAVDLQAGIAAAAEVDKLTIRANARREAWGYKMQAKQIMDAYEAAKKRGDDQAFSNLIKTGAEVAGDIYRNRKSLGLGGDGGSSRKGSKLED